MIPKCTRKQVDLLFAGIYNCSRSWDRCPLLAITVLFQKTPSTRRDTVLARSDVFQLHSSPPWAFECSSPYCSSYCSQQSLFLPEGKNWGGGAWGLAICPWPTFLKCSRLGATPYRRQVFLDFPHLTLCDKPPSVSHCSVRFLKLNAGH